MTNKLSEEEKVKLAELITKKITSDDVWNLEIENVLTHAVIDGFTQSIPTGTQRVTFEFREKI